MFSKTNESDWKALVQKQLKTDDIDSILKKENLESIDIQPYYSVSKKQLPILPKVEESTQLVAHYSEDFEDDVFAFISNEDITSLGGKSIFLTSKTVAKSSNTHYSLVDAFTKDGKISDFVKEFKDSNYKRPICIDVSLVQNAGASIIQQLGVALAKVKDLADEFGTEIFSKVLIKVAIGANYFFEIGKIRALKLVFNQLSKEYGIDQIPYIFAETSYRNKATNDVENNLIRSTLELASAMIGGADAVYSNDYQLINSTDLSKEISFKQQIVLAYESIINVFEDAGNGSYYIEDITKQIADKVWKYFLEIENDGGFVAAMFSGKIQNDIYQHAIQEHSWVEEGKIKLIGVNMYPKLETKKSVSDLYNPTEIKAVRWAELYE